MITGPAGEVWFSDEELSCRCGCASMRVAEGFADALAILRAAYDHPMRVESCSRCPAHNRAIGGHRRSAHLAHGGHGVGTFAIDISGLTDGFLRAKLLKLAIGLGWSVGIISPTAMHLDRRTEHLPHYRAPFEWAYGTH